MRLENFFMNTNQDIFQKTFASFKQYFTNNEALILHKAKRSVNNLIQTTFQGQINQTLGESICTSIYNGIKNSS
jgi:hypothetical protein